MFAGAVLLGGIAMDATDVATSSFAPINDMLGFAAATALWWRRRFPLVVAALTGVAGFFAPFAAGAAILAIFSVAVFRPTRVAVAVATLNALPMVIFAIPHPDRELTHLQSVIAGVLMIFTALGWGMVVRARQQLVESLGERAERAEADQLAQVEQARRAERNRIAGEMHDVLAHRLSLLSLHAGAVEVRPDAPPDELARAAGIIRTNAHLALEELRAVVNVLRTEVGDGPDAGLAPQPTLDSLPALVQECRDAGMRVELRHHVADGAAVPADLGRHAYRVVQEGLTNARKHAPDGAVVVSVSGSAADGLTIEVVNPCGPNGRPGASGPEGHRSDIPGAGVGLVGLAERVDVVGGRIEHGADPSGTHRLAAWLPWST
jgi:signal transduction histidine kinase